MLFDSLNFALFYSITFLCYWLCNKQYRKYILLISSFIFIFSNGVFSLIYVFLFSVISFIFTYILFNNKNKYILLSFILLSVLPLILLKINAIKTVINIEAPIGISFYTLEIIGIMIDIYRERINKTFSYLMFIEYIMFFPIFVSGPIEKGSLIYELENERDFDYSLSINGLKQFGWGLFKKAVIADKIAFLYVDPVFNNVSSYNGFTLVLALLLYSIQIYCDFSGYSDMACGTAKMLGIKITNNFNVPYLSSSIKEFWSRWHISLSSWLKDYIYIPLGGNRCSSFRSNINLLLTFIISGLWHGFSINFVIWGMLHAVGQILERQLNKYRFFKNGNKIIKTIITFSFITFTWIFFRCNTFNDAIFFIKNATNGITNILEYIRSGYVNIGFDTFRLITMMLSLMILIIVDFLTYKYLDFFKYLSYKNIVVRWMFYLLISFMIVYFSSKGIAPEFVYAHF